MGTYNIGSTKNDLQGFGSFILLLDARQGCHCINLYCLMGDATFPSALAPSALVPNAIKLRGLIY
ncbi:hypothetical protein K492DRAFT_175819 [Lichtheimia hyalospora FSU 10163]|nr:hypothetical protein K492DRAFT_175819 [Lichtheimia hyalospora FSU 10163]